MKRCPQCGRDYNDDSLSFCLDDGSELLFGPAAASTDEPATAVLSGSGGRSGESPTRGQYYTTDRTAVFSSGGKPERQALDRPSEWQSTPAHAAEPRPRRATKPLAAAVVAAVFLAGGYFGYKYFFLSTQIESIAVMPFVNESGNADVEYLSDGMTETLISSLSQLPNLNVKPRSGTLSEGKLAAITVLNKNLLKATPSDWIDERGSVNVNVLYTIVGGKVVYAR